jgi:hypothetical protein
MTFMHFCFQHIYVKHFQCHYLPGRKGNIVEASMFSNIATSAEISAAASTDAFTARLLECASAVEAVVKETGDPAAVNQLGYLTWVLCKRSGGKACNSLCTNQGKCARLQSDFLL